MKQQVTIDAELAKNMFWMACRYGVGRHSYVQGYAYDMGAMYNVMSADERRRAAVDIRQCIGDVLHMASFGFTLDWNISREDRKPYEMFLDFMNTHEGVDLTSITNIECYYDEKDSFDHAAFYDWCERQTNLTLISEYSMPEDRFTCVWAKEKVRNLCAASRRTKAMEKLYVPNSQVETYKQSIHRLFI